MPHIIKLDTRHLDQLTDIDFLSEHPNDIQRGLSRRDMKKYIKLRLDKKREEFYGYKIGKELVGYVTLIPEFPGYKHCEVYWLAVKKHFQGKGIGRELMRYIEQIAKNLGFRKVCLYTAKDMPGAQQFYKKIGYKQINEFPGYYGFETGNTTAVLFAKSL